MFNVNRFILAVVAIFSIHASNANAALVTVNAEITALIVRDYGIHFLLTLRPGSAPLAGLQCTNPDTLFVPIVLPTNPNYKAYKDIVMLAFALKRPVNVHFESTKLCYHNAYPETIGVDLG